MLAPGSLLVVFFVLGRFSNLDLIIEECNAIFCGGASRFQNRPPWYIAKRGRRMFTNMMIGKCTSEVVLYKKRNVEYMLICTFTKSDNSVGELY